MISWTVFLQARAYANCGKWQEAELLSDSMERAGEDGMWTGWRVFYGSAKLLGLWWDSACFNKGILRWSTRFLWLCLLDIFGVQQDWSSSGARTADFQQFRFSLLQTDASYLSMQDCPSTTSSSMHCCWLMLPLVRRSRTGLKRRFFV